MYKSMFLMSVFVSMTVAFGLGGLAGGRNEITHDEELMDLAKLAVDTKYNAEANDMKHYIVAAILRAESQVVAGTMKHLHVLMRESDCQKPVEENTVCNAKHNGATKLCYFKIWTKSWEDFQEITLNGCQNVRLVPVFNEAAQQTNDQPESSSSSSSSESGPSSESAENEPETNSVEEENDTWWLW